MNADGLAAFRALPFLLLELHELPDSQFLDLSQVFEHAHSISCPVPFI